MGNTLLRTKLNIPQIRSSLVPRQRLVDKLDAGLEIRSGTFARKLTLVAAPAGFGKTTLLGEWIYKDRRPVAWVSLDEGDNDPALFWAYVITALQKVHPEVGHDALTLLQVAQSPPVTAILTVLLNELAELEASIILVLDDYHTIEARPIHENLDFVLDNLPYKVHMVITTRADLALPLARLRARGELLEIRQSDLRFTLEETTIFLNQAMDLNLSAEDIAVLEERTEGWIAGLQLAALSMQGREDISAFIKTFRGLDRFITEYLVEEVLQSQPQAVQDFLMRTSILDRLSGPLCDALTGQNNGWQMLAQIERANLFLEPLDDEQHWYRYYQLFAKFLRQQLRQLHPGSIPELYSRASQWFEDNGFQFEAVDHAFEAGDNERAAYLIEKSILPFFRSGEVPLTTVRAWLECLPDELVGSRPRLGLTAAWTSLWIGQPDAAETRLGQVERLLTEGSAEESWGLERRNLGELAAVRANIAYMKGEIQETIQHAQRALDTLPPEESFLRSISYNALGQAFRLDGQPLAASRSYSRSAAIGRAERIITTGLLASGYQVRVKAMQGQLRQAQTAFQEALDFASQMGVSALPALGVAYVSMGDVLRQWNDLESAGAKLHQGIELCQQWQALLATVLDGYMSLARVYLAGGNGQDALEVIDLAIRLAERYELPQSLAQVKACQVWLWLAHGHDTAVQDWAKQAENHTSRKMSFAREPEERMLARVFILQGGASKATDLLSRLLQAAEAAGRMADVIEIRVLHALALQASDDVGGALATLERALQLAEPQGFVRAFVDEGPAMEKLLRQAASRGITLDYVNHLLEAFRQTPYPKPPAMAGGQPPAQPLPNPLTKREHEVLRLIAAGLTNREIAEELVVVLGTVKAHINSIYRKLDVSNRVQAVSRARELQLL
ncbi:MAG: hypothetical protein AMJ56_01935 [Anaerolineae bacterium SG8_19]|nr:MAG: hypothetical protein AMJ56_01935 [Anaerolineae bacterium SG8_19]